MLFFVLSGLYPIFDSLNSNRRTGYPENSPSTHSYFEHPLHRNDQYSIAASIVFKNSVNGDDLVFGNDFDHPIRDRLPPGFNTALRIVKWTLDPAIDGDAYADQPYLYSPALATWNQFHIGHAAQTSNGLSLHDLVVQEGAEDGPAAAIRRDNGIPDQVDARRKYFQNAERRKQFGFEPGRLYLADFGNPYLGFSGTSKMARNKKWEKKKNTIRSRYPTDSSMQTFLFVYRASISM